MKQGSGGSDSGSFPCCLNTCVFSSAAQRQEVKGWGLKGDGWTSVAKTQSVRAWVSSGGGRTALGMSCLQGDGGVSPGLRGILGSCVGGHQSGTGHGRAGLSLPAIGALNMQSKGESTFACSSFSDIFPISHPRGTSGFGLNGTDLASKMLFPQ